MISTQCLSFFISAQRLGLFLVFQRLVDPRSESSFIPNFKTHDSGDFLITIFEPTVKNNHDWRWTQAPGSTICSNLGMIPDLPSSQQVKTLPPPENRHSRHYRTEDGSPQREGRLPGRQPLSLKDDTMPSVSSTGPLTLKAVDDRLPTLVLGFGILVVIQSEVRFNLANYGSLSPMQEVLVNQGRGKTTTDLLRTASTVDGPRTVSQLWDRELFFVGGWSFMRSQPRVVVVYRDFVKVGLAAWIWLGAVRIVRRGFLQLRVFFAMGTDGLYRVGSLLYGGAGLSYGPVQARLGRAVDRFLVRKSGVALVSRGGRGQRDVVTAESILAAGRSPGDWLAFHLRPRSQASSAR